MHFTKLAVDDLTHVYAKFNDLPDDFKFSLVEDRIKI